MTNFVILSEKHNKVWRFIVRHLLQLVLSVVVAVPMLHKGSDDMEHLFDFMAEEGSCQKVHNCARGFVKLAQFEYWQ